MRAACRCSQSGYPCQAYRVALEVASVPQTARRVAGVGCKVGQASGEFSGTFWFVRKRQPLALYRFNKIDELGSIDENMVLCWLRGALWSCHFRPALLPVSSEPPVPHADE